MFDDKDYESKTGDIKDITKLSIVELITELKNANGIISKQKQDLNVKQEELASLENSNNFLLENFGYPYLIIDEKGTILKNNKEFLCINKKVNENIINKNISEFIQLDNLTNILKNIDSNKIPSYSDKCTISDNMQIYNFTIKKFNQNNHKNYLITFFEQIIGQQFNSRDILYSIVDSLDDAIFIHNINGNILEVITNNDDNLFLPKNELIGKTHYDFFDEETAAQFTKEFNKLIETNEPQSFQYQNPNNPNQYFCTKFTLTQPNENGESFIVSYVRDNTVQVNNSEALKQSEKKYKLIAENANDVIWTADLSGKLTFVSPSGEKLYGYSFPNEPELYIKDVLTEESYMEYKRLAKLRNIEKQGGEKSGSYNLIQQHITKDGNKIWVEANTNPLRDENGELIGIVGVSRDISQRIKSEEALKESEQKYQFLSDVTNEAIIVSENGKVLSYNRYAKKMFGSLIRTNKKINFKEIVLPEFHDLVKANRNIETTETFNIKIYDKNNEIKWVEVHAKNLEYNDKILRIVSFRDISDRIENELLIKKLSTAVEQNPVSIVITNTHGKIEYINPTFSKTTGYDYDEALGKNPRILKSDKTPKDTYKDLWSTIIKGKIWEGEFINIKKSGEEYYEKAIISPIIDSNNKIVNFIGVKQDITKQKLNEKLIKEQNEKLTELNYTKNKFFSIIAHDLKNPFTALLNLSDLLKNYKDSLSEVETDKIITNISDASQNTYKLLENLLIWAKSQMQGIEFRPHLNDLYDITQNVLYALKAQYDNKKIKIINKIEPDFIFKFDQNMLDTILRNIITNAIKFSFENSKIYINAIRKDNDVIISVKDSGTGMNDKQIANLFKLEKNISTKGTMNEKGTGLGLILSKEFIDYHNGSIRVESVKNEGSTFYISLPYLK